MGGAKRPTEPAWLKIDAKLRRPAEFAGLAQMVAGYEREASQWFEEYCKLEELRASGSFSAKKYEAHKATYGRYRPRCCPSARR